MRVFKAPEPLIQNQYSAVFLAGSIDMGTAQDWQAEVCNHFSDTDKNIYNPRRDDWDNSWEQKIDNPQFNQQVNWELSAMEKADLIIMNFLPGSASPITLLELGLHAGSKKLVVCCPDDYYRRGNVHIVCNNYNIPLFKNLDELLESIKNKS
ncbi:nucleoside 2-deoxyribosyltransferase domain-containing protein [Ferruginibacter sp. SUN106]|uniref:nucleoside 2-deoxyribosyltransferase domain-containing protein n=1 Tax=Ferruginibacter sp. SUN106 TaxID=2978348 RepID=UPI003D36A809